jgi:proline racemase
LPQVGGRAFVCAETTLLDNPADPFRYGFASQLA